MRISHPALLVGIALALSCGWPLATEAATPLENRPNIVLIVADDAGYADLSIHGSAHFKTPHIERIASDGVLFRQGYAASSVCSPSRAGLLTGRYPQRSGHHNNPPPVWSDTFGLSLDERTLADSLRQRGYRTIAVGKWHLGYHPDFHPLSRGFDDFYGFLHGSRSYFPIEGDVEPAEALWRDRRPAPEDFEYLTDAFGHEAAAYIDANASAPFFLYLAFSAPHVPLDAPKEAVSTIAPELTRKRKVLAAMTQSMDDAIGEVLQALERNGVTDDTLVLFVNDNGGETWAQLSDNSPLRGRKSQPYEGGIRVPFTGRWPAAWPQGVVYDSPVSLLDIFPTALVAAGGNPKTANPPLDGVDLTAVLNDKGTTAPHPILFWKHKTNFAVRDGNWKLVEHNTRGRKQVPIPRWIESLELYDLETDPAERQNLALRYPWITARLRYRYWQWERTLPSPRWHPWDPSASEADPRVDLAEP